MTTPNTEELITYLRSFFIDENVSAIKANWIANALQSQAERIKVIERESEMRRIELHDVMLESDQLRAQLADAELHTKQVERGLDKATAQLAEIEKTEPVAWINLAASSKMFRFLAPTEEDGTVVKDWQPLFTRPVPAQDVTELVDCLDELCDIVEGVVEDKSSVGSLIDSFTTQPARTTLSKYKGAK